MTDQAAVYVGGNRMPETEFESDLAELLNRHSIENHSNTPDFILAEYMTNCLAAFTVASNKRGKWYGHSPDMKEKVELKP